MGAKPPSIPDPNAETPGVIIGDAGFSLSRRLASLTGQPASTFRRQAAARSPSDPVSFLRDLLSTERRRKRTEPKRTEPKRTEPKLPSEPPSRGSPTVQAAVGGSSFPRGRGRASTILTGFEAAIPAGSAVRKTLLGGA